MVLIKNEQQINCLRDAGTVVAETHRQLAKAVRPGITTKQLDTIAEQYIRKQGGIPAFKGYYGYPATICASINHVVVHGIPDDRKLQEGEIVSIDVGAIVNGFCADAAVTLPVGEVSLEAIKLIKVTEQSLYRGIEQARPGNRLTNISHAIQTYVEQNQFSVVRSYGGHGIGRQLHEQPLVPNFGPPGKGVTLQSGIALAIEPMVNAGSYRVMTNNDGWTVVTQDGSLSAHFEHTIVITDKGPEILTKL